MRKIGIDERTSWYWSVHELPHKLMNPLNVHEIPEWNFHTPTWMGIFHPRNWLSQETSHRLALSLHRCKFLKWSKATFILCYWNLLSFQDIYGSNSFQEMHSNSSWEEIPKNATCTTIPNLPLPPNHMWKHISFPKFLECPIGAIFIPEMPYISNFSIHI